MHSRMCSAWIVATLYMNTHPLSHAKATMCYGGCACRFAQYPLHEYEINTQGMRKGTKQGSGLGVYNTHVQPQVSLQDKAGCLHK